jgi:hypothetical protein
MTRIDLDDLPPRIARALAGLADGEEVVLVQGPAAAARLVVAEAPPAADPLAGLPPEEAMAEVMDHFKAIIEDEF